MNATNVVIGAGSGMGAAVATLLAARGPLLLADCDTGGLDAVASGLGPDADGVRTIGCDITVPAQVDAVVDAVVKGTGRLGALVITAGLSPAMAPGRRIYEVNLLGSDRVVRSFEPALGPGSAAVVFASMAGHMAPPSAEIDAVLDDPTSPTFFDDLAGRGIDVDQPQMAYVYSKYGVLRLVRRHAGAWGARGARLLSLSPGIVDTGMGRLEAEHEPAMADMVAGSPLGRMARPDEVAAVAACLTSETASFMTGVDVLVDGGAVGALTAGG